MLADPGKHRECIGSMHLQAKTPMVDVHVKVGLKYAKAYGVS